MFENKFIIYDITLMWMSKRREKDVGWLVVNKALVDSIFLLRIVEMFYNFL